ncbi:MAG: radical SAM protein [Candidatus Korobacteraceae bacterium]
MADGANGRVAELPILVLNAHSRCNCRCVMCDIWKREDGTEITVADLERHRSSLRRLSVEWVVISGGEPLMHGDLAGLCNFLRELDVHLTLLTTGLLLERRAAEVASLFDDVIVSLDGPAEVHDAIRRVKGSFQSIQSGVAALHALRPAMRIRGRTTVQKANHHLLQNTVGSAMALGLDGISFLAVDVTSEAFNRPLLWPEEKQHVVTLSAEETSVLEQEIEEVIVHYEEEIRSGYVAECPAKLRKIAAQFRAYLGQVQHESPRCNAPWVSAVIEADGAVRPCFFQPAIGNIRKSSLEEIINGEAARSFRHNLDVAKDPICQRCVCSLNHPVRNGLPS